MSYLNEVAPPSYQESYDNCGLLLGNPSTDISGVLVTLDITPNVVLEAVKQGCNVIVAHHPIIFSGIKKICPKRADHQSLLSCIKNEIAIIAIHTNLDSVIPGVSSWLASQLGLKNIRVLMLKKDTMGKAVVYVPITHVEEVLQALYDAGAGHIGEYDQCSFQIDGVGTFRGSNNTNPFLGKPGIAETVNEKRIEVIFPLPIQDKIVAAIRASHPYEEEPFEMFTILNTRPDVGFGAIGQLDEPMEPSRFLNEIKSKLSLRLIRHTSLPNKDIKTVAVCGGSGSFLIGNAKGAKADAYITADLKYHEFFEGDDEMMLCDIGHYESEVFMKANLAEIINKKFPTFATQISETITNPILYQNS